MLTIQEAKSLLTLASVALACVAWLRMRPPRGRLFKRLGVLLWLGFAVELLGTGTFLFNVPNGPIYTVYGGIEFTLVLSLVIIERPELRGLVLTAGVFGLAALLLNIYFETDSRFMANLGIMTMASISSVFMLNLLWHLAEHVEGQLWHEPRVWLFLGLLLHFVALAPTMGSMKFIWNRYPIVAINLWTIVQVLAIARYVLTGIACLKTAQRRGAFAA